MGDRLNGAELAAKYAEARGLGEEAWRVAARHDAVGLEFIALETASGKTGEVLRDTETGRVSISVRSGDRVERMETDMDGIACDPDLTDCVIFAPAPR